MAFCKLNQHWCSRQFAWQSICIVTVKSNLTIAICFPLEESWKILWVHPWYCFVSWGEVIFGNATSLLMSFLFLTNYHTVLHECLYFLCQVIHAVGRKTVISVLASENCAERRLLAQYLQCWWGSGSLASSGHEIYWQVSQTHFLLFSFLSITSNWIFNYMLVDLWRDRAS